MGGGGGELDLRNKCVLRNYCIIIVTKTDFVTSIHKFVTIVLSTCTFTPLVLEYLYVHAMSRLYCRRWYLSAHAYDC